MHVTWLLPCPDRLGQHRAVMALEIRNLQRTEVHEVEESFGKGQKGSSAMPHKAKSNIKREYVRMRACSADI